METDELTDLTVQEQEDELQDLPTEKLQNLREQETRRTALDNIDNELSQRQPEQEETEQETSEEPVEEDSDQQDEEEDDPRAESEQPEPAQDRGETVMENDRLEELEAKVDYLIENCKTTSHQGFENYEA